MELDDLDLDSDPVRDFLDHKLRNVRALKASANETLLKLHRMLDEADHSKTDQKLRLLDVWHSTCDGRVVLQVKLRNENDTPVKNLNVAMQWKPSSTSLSYSVNVYSSDHPEGFRTELVRNGVLSVAVERPSFAKHSKFEANLSLLYDCDGRHHRLELPPLVIDLAKLPVEVKNLDVVGGKFEHTLARLCCLRRIALAATLPNEFARRLDHYLLVDCMLREVAFRGGRYFAFDGVAGDLDGCLVSFDDAGDVYDLNVYYRTVDDLHCILHHLHVNVDGINVLPATYKASLKEEASREAFAPSQTQRRARVGADASSFAAALRRQVDQTFDFHVNTLNCAQLKPDEDVGDEYRILREFLARNERECDAFCEKFNS